MRAEELVGRAREEVRADRLDVDGDVRRGVDGIDVRPGAGLVCSPDELADGVDRADGVRGPAERDAACGRPWSAASNASMSSVTSSVRTSTSRTDESTVPRDARATGPTFASWSSFVTTSSSPSRMVAPIERATCIVSEVMLAPNLISEGSAAWSRSASAARLSSTHCVAAARGEERPAVVRVRLAVVAGHRLDHRVGDLGATRPVEQRHGTAILLDGEGGEPGAQRRDVEAHPRMLAARQPAASGLKIVDLSTIPVAATLWA